MPISRLQNILKTKYNDIIEKHKDVVSDINKAKQRNFEIILRLMKDNILYISHPDIDPSELICIFNLNNMIKKIQALHPAVESYIIFIRILTILENIDFSLEENRAIFYGSQARIILSLINSKFDSFTLKPLVKKTLSYY